MEYVKLLSFCMYASVSFKAGNVYATYSQDLDMCDTIVEGQFYSRMLKEVSPIGTEVHTLPTLSSNLSHHFFIEDSTNKDERFKVSSNGTVYLSGYLDYEIDQNYTLSVLSYNGLNNTAGSVCVRHKVEVFVVDDAHWPRPFNESCCACQKGKSRSRDYPFVAEILLGEEKASFGMAGLNFWRERVYADSTDDCRITMYVIIDGFQLQNLIGLFSSVVPFNIISFSCTTLNSEYRKTMYGGRLRLYESINSLPPHLQKEVWFLTRRDDRFIQVHLSDEVYRLIYQIEPIFSCDGAVPGRDYVYTITWGIRILGCPDGYYGVDCSEVCICKNGATCHAVIGSCKCAPGWQGPACDIRRSEVVLNATGLEVYTGDYVEMQANIYNIKLINTPISWYLNGSDEFLNEKNHFTSSVNTTLNITHLTISNFKDDFAGIYVCSVIDSSGNNITATKILSAKGCHKNYYGENCDLLCSCENSAECDRYRGCICQAGWMGTHCDRVCPSGWFGSNCTSQCLCENNSTCNPENGHCTCMTATCGSYCHIQCKCDMDIDPVCDEKIGKCLCEEPDLLPSGETELLPESETDLLPADKTGNEAFVIAVLGVVSGTLSLCACIACVAYCYRGRHHGFKTIIDTEFDSFIEDLFHEHPDLDTWVLKRKDIKVRKEIGFGEFGRSELAELRRGNGTLMVALKSLITNRRHCLSISYRDFCHEIACLKRLHGHPNIISLLGIVVSGDPKYIVIEYAARGDLLSYLRGLRSKNVSRLEEEKLVRISRDVTLALQHLEENMFIHRDIACRNVLIMEDYVAKIGDFGLSRDIYETGKYCKDKWSQVHGPLPLKWMAPEFLQVGVHDQKSDIWSYGVLLWEIATLGETPFTNVPVTEMVKFLLNGQRLGQPETCTDRLYNIMLRCWQLKPVDRPNAKDLADHLEEVSRHEERFFTATLPDLTGLDE
ncbi:uncharacterized protein [Ptychodera flava]|uniref:uncharacterized protein n=1 Tax=Ptychodera flava TaxID=63121 RepID=UPI003969EBB0